MRRARALFIGRALFFRIDYRLAKSFDVLIFGGVYDKKSCCLRVIGDSFFFGVCICGYSFVSMIEIYLFSLFILGSGWTAGKLIRVCHGCFNKSIPNQKILDTKLSVSNL